MNLYYFIFIWIVIMALLSQIKDVTRETIVEEEKVYRWRLGMATLAFAPVIYLAAFTTPRSDTALYMSIYRNLPTSLYGLLANLTVAESGQGFIIFEWVIKNISGGSEWIFRLLLALLHSLPVLYVFRKYSDDFILSLYLFVATGCHIGWMMNGLRQFLAVSIIMAATPLMLKKKYIPLIAVIFLAIAIHSSAILMLPVVFIVQGKAWNRKTLFFIFASILMMYLFSRYTSLLDNLLANTEYAGAMTSAAEMGDDGTNPIRVLVNSIPMLMALVGRKYLIDEDNVLINLCINMSVITTGLYLVSMVTSGIMFGRLPIYTSLYNCILLPFLIKRIFTKDSAKFLTILMIILYFAYYLYAYRGF